MKIDFHTHAFTESIAQKAISNLEATASQKALTDGTVASLLSRFDEWGVDKGVVLTIATKPTQQKTINDWAASIASDRVIPFGTVHFAAPDALCELERIKSLGLKGVKLHPDYQGFEIDDEKMLPIYKKCAELGLVVMFHAGFDAVSPEHIHARPKASRKVHEAVPDMKMVLAHMGGNDCADEVLELLAGCGGEVYFDTSYIANTYDDETVMKIIDKHGADRILFASDCPWCSSKLTADMINRLPIGNDDKEKIFYKNAEGLLKI